MSTAARKARKKAGIQFVAPVKVGTPLEQRIVPFVVKSIKGVTVRATSNRARTRIRRLIEARDQAVSE